MRRVSSPARPSPRIGSTAGLGPASSTTSSASARCARTCGSSSLPPPNAARPSTTCCSMARRGLGKTTLAQIVARELGVGIRTTSGPVIARAGDLAAILTNLNERDVLFVDEIPPAQPGGGGDPLSGHGGFAARPDHRRGAGRALGADRPAPLHPGGRHHAHGPHHDAAARALWHPAQARFLRGGRAGRDRDPQRGASQCRH